MTKYNIPFSPPDITEEEIAEWDEDEIIEELSNNYTYLGEEDGIYYVM